MQSTQFSRRSFLGSAAASSLLCRSGAAGATQTGEVANPPDRSDLIQRIAFGSYAKQWQHQTIWKAVLDLAPDVFLFLGDAIYSDTDGVTATSRPRGSQTLSNHGRN